MVTTRTTVFADGNILSAAQLNGEFNNLLNAPAIVNADISGSAGIVFSKLDNATVAGLTATQTFTNKRVTRRVYTQASGVSIDVNSDSYDGVLQINTAGSGTLTLNNPTGTPTDQQGLIYRIQCSSSQTYAFGNQFKGGITLLPSTHAGSSKFDYLGFIWNGTATTWDLVGLMQAIG